MIFLGFFLKKKLKIPIFSISRKQTLKKKIKKFIFFKKNLGFFERKENFLKKNLNKKNRKNLISFFQNKWAWELSLGVFFLFFGFFSATSAITIIGSVADWDPLAAAVMLCWMEIFTKYFYKLEKVSLTIKLINGFKIGLILGMFVDALKLTG